MSWLLFKLRWNWRIWRNRCPACNSDAPALDTCWLCHYIYGYPVPHYEEAKAVYRKALCIARWKED
jgi:hypothetical protein